MESVWDDSLSRSQQAFFLLLRSGLWECDISDFSLFPLSQQEWDDVFHMAGSQTVQGLVYRGFQHLPDDLFPSQSQVWQWVSIAARLEKEYRQFCQQTADTFQMLDKEGLQPFLQKGLAVAQYYEHPELRVNGDIDWYLDGKETLAGVLPWLEHQGYQPECHSDGSISFTHEGTEVELHRQLVDLDSPCHRKAVRQLLGTDHTGETLLLSDTRVRVPAPIATLILLNAHLMKHAFTVGVGLRQFCDMARAYHRLYRHYDASALATAYRRTGLWQWSRLMHRFLISYLGMPADELPSPTPAYPHDCQRLLRQVLREGNFGQHAEHWQKAHSKGRNRCHTVRQIIGRLPFSLRYAPVEMMCKMVALA